MSEKRRIRVLIADDSPEAAHGLRGILRACSDMEVVGEAVNGSDAVAKAELLRPDIILMDAQMPGEDGVEATRRIKKSHPDMKVVILTVHAEFIELAQGAGADGCLMKDSSRDELVTEIRRLRPRAPRP